MLLLKKTYHSVMRILAHVLVDVPACDLHISATLDEFYTPSPFLNAEVNGEGQVQCLHRKMLIIITHGMFVLSIFDTCKAVALSLPGFSASTTSCLRDS